MNRVVTNWRSVTVAGQPKGDVYRRFSRWHWYRNNGATQGWPRSATLADVRASIARDCLATPADVKIHRVRWLTQEEHAT